MSYLLDTCAISEIVKREPDKRMSTFLKEQAETNLYLSVITIGELIKGVELSKSSARKEKLATWVQQLQSRFAHRILNFDAEVAQKWGTMLAQAPRTLPAIDSLIAATAQRHELILVTRNEKDFEGTGVEVLNLWSA